MARAGLGGKTLVRVKIQSPSTHTPMSLQDATIDGGSMAKRSNPGQRGTAAVWIILLLHVSVFPCRVRDMHRSGMVS